MNIRPEFQIVCVNCDAIGVVLDYPEDAPSTTSIKCRACGASRGTLGDLRYLAQSGRRDLFEID